MAHMATREDIHAIRSFKEKLLATAANYEALAAKARAEAADYEIAERVLLKISGANGDGRPSVTEMTRSNDDVGAADGVRKPPSIPTLPAMITEGLTIAHKNGLPGLEPSGALEFIRTRYWADVKGPDVSSTMWRMWKDGRLTKPDENSPLYTLLLADLPISGNAA